MNSKVHVRVKAGSKKGPLVEVDGTELAVYVREPAIDGKANQAVTALLAKYFKVPKTQVTLRSGAGAKYKVFEIA